MPSSPDPVDVFPELRADQPHDLTESVTIVYQAVEHLPSEQQARVLTAACCLLDLESQINCKE